MSKAINFSDFIEWLEEYMLDNEMKFCSACGKIMTQGYCIEGGADYFCTDECLYTDMTKEEWEEIYDDGNGDSYWTEWEVDENALLLVKYLNERIPELDYKFA